jgi:hypothetical protein
MTLDSQQVFGDQLIRRTIIETTAVNGWADGSGMNMSRGTMTVEARPQSFNGTFHVTSLEVALSGEATRLDGRGTVLEPLPADEQPDQDDPLTGGPGPSPSPGTGPGSSAAPTAAPIDGDGSGAVPPVPGGKPPPDAFPGDSLPDFQLFDRVSQQWVEFPHPESSHSYLIAAPERYVDDGGAVLFRFVNRSDPGEFGEDQRYFQLLIRLEGTIG